MERAGAIALYERFGFVQEGYRQGALPPRRRIRRRGVDGVQNLAGRLQAQLFVAQVAAPFIQRVLLRAETAVAVVEGRAP